MTGLARIAAEFGADWIVPFDADEFWLAPEGLQFQDCLSNLPEDVTKCEVKVQNYVQEASVKEFHYTDMSTVKFRAVEQEYLNESQSQKAVASGKTSFICVPFLSKVIFRASPDVVVQTGNHNVSFPLDKSPVGSPTGIRIAHLPYRASSLLKSRVSDGQKLQQAKFHKSVGWHSQRLVTMSPDDLAQYWNSVAWHVNQRNDHKGLEYVADDTLINLQMDDNCPFHALESYPSDLPQANLNELLLLESLKRIGTDLRHVSKREKLQKLFLRK
jgi:hypothetical protein